MTDDSGFQHRFVAGSAPNPALTIVALHGTGGDENDLLPLAAAIAPGAPVLSPRGKVLEHGAPRFFRRLAEGVFDYADVRFRAAELNAFIRSSAERYGFDGGRLYALGYSNGANIASAMMFEDPELFAGGILLRPMIPLDPLPGTDLRGISVLLSAGLVDPIIPPDQVRRLESELVARGAKVELIWQPGGHSLTATEIDLAREWLSQHGG